MTTNVVVVTDDQPVAFVTSGSSGSTTVSTSGAVVVEEVDVVGVQGKQGEQGPQGVAGAAGPAGASALNPIVFRQDEAASTWTIVHGLNTFPVVVVVDSANETVMGDVSYLDPNTVQLTFGAPFSGIAYLL